MGWVSNHKNHKYYRSELEDFQQDEVLLAVHNQSFVQLDDIINLPVYDFVVEFVEGRKTTIA